MKTQYTLCFVSEYYILLLLVFLIDFIGIIILINIQKKKHAKAKELKELKNLNKELENRIKFYQVTSLALASSTCLALNTHGDSDNSNEIIGIEIENKSKYSILTSIDRKLIIMSQYLAYSYSTSLTKEEKIRIDKQVARNREIVYLCVTKFPKNVRLKAKRLYIYVMCAVSLSVSLSPCAAVMLPPPTAVHRLHFIDVNRIVSQSNSPRPAPSFAKLPDKLVFSEKQMDQLYDLAVKYGNGCISKNDLMLELRGGATDPKELAVQIMIMHHLMSPGPSFLPPIRAVPHPDQVRRLPIGRPRMRRQEFPIEPKLEGPVNLGIGYDPLPPSRLFAKPNGQGHDSQGKPIRIISRIKEHPSLKREAERMGKDQSAQRDLNNLLDQLALGNENPGIGSKPIGGGISELRGFNEGRVYYRKLQKSKETVYEDLGKSNKDNQEKVVALVKKYFL